MVKIGVHTLYSHPLSDELFSDQEAAEAAYAAELEARKARKVRKEKARKQAEEALLKAEEEERRKAEEARERERRIDEAVRTHRGLRTRLNKPRIVTISMMPVPVRLKFWLRWGYLSSSVVSDIEFNGCYCVTSVEGTGIAVKNLSTDAAAVLRFGNSMVCNGSLAEAVAETVAEITLGEFISRYGYIEGVGELVKARDEVAADAREARGVIKEFPELKQWFYPYTW